MGSGQLLAIEIDKLRDWEQRTVKGREAGEV